MDMPINKKPLLSKFNLWYYQLVIGIFFALSILGLLIAVFFTTATDLSLPVSLTEKQAADQAVVKRQTELSQLYKQYEQEKLQQQKEAAKQAYIDEISQEKEIILSGQTYRYYFQLLEASSTAECWQDNLSGRLALVLNERVVAEHEFCGEEYPQIKTYKLGEKFLIFLSHGVLDAGVDSIFSSPNLSNNQHVLIIIDDSGALQRQVIGYGESDLQVEANDNEVIYHHDSFLPELYPEVLTKMKDLATCFTDINQCTGNQIILAEGARDGLGGVIKVIERLRINSNGQLFSVYQRVLAPETFCSLQNPDCVQALEKYIMDKQQCYQGNLACKSTDKICLQQRSLCLSHLNEEFLDKVWQWRDFTNVN